MTNYARTALVAGALFAACVYSRTEIMLRIRTDMTQGPGAQLAAIRVRVFGDGQAQPLYATKLPLGPGGVTLPNTLGLVPRGDKNGLVTVEIDALDEADGVLFTKTASARYVSGRTLLLEVFLAARCRQASAQSCPGGESCGAAGCEPNLRENLPAFDGQVTPSEDLAVADLSMPMDMSMANEDMSVADLSVAGDLSLADSSVAAPDQSMPDLRMPADMTMPRDMTIVDLLDPIDVDAGDPAIPAPRPLLPASTGITTSMNVKFQWALTPPATGARVQICADRACASILQTIDVPGESTRITLVPSPGASHVYFFRLIGTIGVNYGAQRSKVWSFSVGGPSPTPTPMGSWGTIHDLNGDGLSDLFGGAPNSDEVRYYKGKSPAGTAPAAEARFTSPGMSQKLGSAIVGAGDLNGDGFFDLAIGTQSQILVYHGKSTAFSSPLVPGDANVSIALPAPASRHNVAAAGDVDRNGYADLVVGDPAMGRILIFNGDQFGVSSVGTPIVRGEAGFGKAVAGACDVNADGYADLIVGGDDNALVMLGSDLGPSSVITLNPGPSSSPAPTLFGASVACAGDVNGDGYADVIVGAPNDDSAFVYHGGPTGVSSSPNGALRKVAGETGTPTKNGDAFGTVVSAAGDLNSDGYSDVVVAAPVDSGINAFTGTVFVFHGSSTGFVTTAVNNSTTHSRALGATAPNDRPQLSQYAGDVNGDGVGDLVSGAPLRGAGFVYLSIGVPGGLISTTPTWELAGTVPTLSGFGTAIAWVWPAASNVRTYTLVTSSGREIPYISVPATSSTAIR